MNVAVVGVGSMGSNHARILHEMKGVILVAICDINSKAKNIATLYNCNFYSRIEDLIKSENLHAVIIATPTTHHVSSALPFINARIPTLIEKPLADTILNAKKIVTAAKKKKVPLVVGHVERFNPAIDKLRNLINSKEFGEIITVSIKRVGMTPPRKKDVNVVIDLAVHDIDIITSILGEKPRRVFAHGGTLGNDNNEDYADIVLDFGGLTCFIQVNWVTPIKIRTLSITFTNGYVELNYISQVLKIYKIQKPVIPNTFKESMENYGEPQSKIIRVSKKEPLRIELEQFLKFVKGKKSLIVTGDEGLRTLIVAEKVNKSIHERKMQIV